MPRRLLLFACATFACGAPAPAKTDPAPAAPPPAAPAKAPEAPPAPFATPKAKPPPAPEGAVLLDPPLYVQRCDPAHACPKLQQPAGETHCRDLELGGLDHWRLPDRDEAKRFSHAELVGAEGFHWTRTPFAEDAAQAWIVDPKTGQETTIPRTRKPFTIRCVFDP
jgi:hypothetical protein